MKKQQELVDYLVDSWMPIPNEATATERGIKLQRHRSFTCLGYRRPDQWTNWLVPHRTCFEPADLDEALTVGQRFFLAAGADAYSLLVAPDLSGWLLAAGERAGLRLAEVVSCCLGQTKEAWQLVTAQLTADQQAAIVRADTVALMMAVLDIDDSYAEHSDEDLARVCRQNIEQQERGEGAFFLSTDDGQPVAAASLRFIENKGLAYLSGATTIAAHRHQGHYRALLAARLAAALERGYEYAATHAVSTTSAPILTKSGFGSLASLTVLMKELTTGLQPPKP